MGLASIPHTNLQLRLALALQNAGFLSTVVRGGVHPPPPHQLLSHPTFNREETGNESTTQDKIAAQRLWLGMKYWNSEPVLEKMQMISKPTRRIWIDTEGLATLLVGKQSGYVRPIRRPSECIFVTTDQGILEARECVERKVGGMLLCRVY